jgi:uncharacterized protein (DUF2267 family)/ferritin-like metal-binding protein YciE
MTAPRDPLAGVDVFDKSLHTTNLWLKEVGEHIGPDRQRCYHALRAVLFSLRDRLTPEAAAHLAAQLPTLIRGIFYEGYSPAGKPEKIRSQDEFLQRIDDHLGQVRPIGAADAARAVFRVLDRRIGGGELEKLKSSLPRDIRSLFPAEPEPRLRIGSFEAMYICELQELASAEEQLSHAFLRFAEKASHAKLRSILERHREGTLLRKQRLSLMLEKHGADSEAHADQAVQALLRETGKMLTILKGEDLRDAGLIASVQKLEHYQIAAYGTAAALAGQLDLRDEQRTLHQSLEEERQMDIALTELAKGEVNRHAFAP